MGEYGKGDACRNCGVKYSQLRKGRCARCAQYWYRNGEERPSIRTDRESCKCGECGLCQSKRERDDRIAASFADNPTMIGQFREPDLSFPEDGVELAYIAGIIDGEGCITRQETVYRVYVGMTDREAIELLDGIGGKVTVRPPGDHRQTLFRWRLIAQLEVREFLTAIMPYLRVKAGLAQEAVEDIERRMEVRGRGAA